MYISCITQYLRGGEGEEGPRLAGGDWHAWWACCEAQSQQVAQADLTYVMCAASSGNVRIVKPLHMLKHSAMAHLNGMEYLRCFGGGFGAAAAGAAGAAGGGGAGEGCTGLVGSGAARGDGVESTAWAAAGPALNDAFAWRAARCACGRSAARGAGWGGAGRGGDERQAGPVRCVDAHLQRGDLSGLFLQGL